MVVIIPSARFRDNPALKGREDKFIQLDVKVAPILASWRESMFSHEWLTADGKIKKPSDMLQAVRDKRLVADNMIDNLDAYLDRPVLGIGILDNIEIGSGRDLFLCLAARGMETVPVHIPKSHESDFRIFIR